ncbi:TPA: hypothetical protein HA338_02955 [Methanosarcina acetivorans]|uniref:Uncharacterized protein n=1 Tax=Methanosarcina acetivorans TaxID=2214 RepID=A0A832SGM2_9EURY|nr:hypothetical protein [Methanosarcina acetivorans]HIH93025.1 hypothetical protein [Methanosarcina acetivorans]
MNKFVSGLMPTKGRIQAPFYFKVLPEDVRKAESDTCKSDARELVLSKAAPVTVIPAEGDSSGQRKRKSSPAVQLLSGRKEFFQVRAHKLWGSFPSFQASCQENQGHRLQA